jgi:anti-sigma regulatory factor (Ser/Thr protein kinase)
MNPRHAAANQIVRGPVHSQYWGSVGFRLDDPSAVFHCRRAARWMLQCWELSDVDVLVDDVAVMVSELVTNVQKHAASDFPAGSFTLWAPGDRVVLTVHDKGDLPWVTNWWSVSDSKGLVTWTDWLNGMSATAGRGLAIVRELLSTYDGTIDVVSDGDQENPGKVFRVTIPLPEPYWKNRPADPFAALASA